MNDNRPPHELGRSPVGLGGGLASAALFAASAKESGFALTLAYFTYLPLMIAALGYPLPGAAVGALAGAFLLAFLLHPLLGLAFFAAFGVPAVALGAIAGRPRKAPAEAPIAFSEHALIWFSSGAILFFAVLLSICLTLFALFIVAGHYGGADNALQELTVAFAPLLDELAASFKTMLPDLRVEAFKRVALLSIPAAMAASSLLMMSLNLWLAGRIVEMSGRLPRAWPDLPRTLRLPRIIVLWLVAGVGMMLRGGPTAAVGGALASTSILALAFQGLAVLHATTRGARTRLAMLSALYAVIVVLEPWPIFISP